AIVIAAASSAVRVCGLALDERARRVAQKAGATRILVANGTPATELAAWAAEHPDRPLVVVDATDHVIHMPLIKTVAGSDTLIAVDESSGFAGAILAVGPRRE